MISEIYVSHFRSIGDATISLGQTNVFVGKNGSGKSNIVDAISFINDIASEDLDFAIVKRHGIDSIRQWSKFKPYHITIQVRTANPRGVGAYKIVISSSRNNYKIVEEQIRWIGETTYDDVRYDTLITRNAQGFLSVQTDYDDDDLDLEDISKSKFESNQAMISSFGRRLHLLNWIVSYLRQELQSFSAFSIFPNTIRAPQTISRAVNLEADGKNIASVIRSLSSDARRKIVKHLKVVFPQLVGITVKSAAGYYVPVFQISEPNETGHHELNMSQISDGTLRILGMLTAFYQINAPNKIVIEEPEQMIHPALLIVIRDAILDYVHRDPNAQIFITTHSSVMMDLFEEDSIIAVEHDGFATRAGPVSKRQLDVVRSGLMTLGEVVLAEGLEIDKPSTHS